MSIAVERDGWSTDQLACESSVLRHWTNETDLELAMLVARDEIAGVFELLSPHHDTNVMIDLSNVEERLETRTHALARPSVDPDLAVEGDADADGEEVELVLPTVEELVVVLAEGVEMRVHVRPRPDAGDASDEGNDYPEIDPAT